VTSRQFQRAVGGKEEEEGVRRIEGRGRRGRKEECVMEDSSDR
jgi:hypothetical protein